MTENNSTPTAKEGKEPVKANVIERGQQLIDQLKQVDFSKEDESTVSVVAEFNEKTANDLIAAWEMKQLHYCQSVSMHTSKVAVLGAIAIELEKGNLETAKDWCFEALDQSDCSEWQLYQDANEFYQSHKLEYPMSVVEHRENVKQHNAVLDADKAKWKVIRADNEASQPIEEKALSTDGDYWFKEELSSFLVGHELEIGDVFKEGDVCYPVASNYFDIDVILDNASEAAGDECGDFAYGFTNINQDKKLELQKLIHNWVNKNIPIDFFLVEEIVEKTVTPEMLINEELKSQEPAKEGNHE